MTAARQGCRPFFRHLPRWIYQSSAYEELNPGERWCLHMIASRCEQVVDDIGSRRGCFVGEPLCRVIGCPPRTFRRMLHEMRRVGLVVKVGQGGGRGLGNELAIPGTRGALDNLDVGDDDRFVRPKKTRPKRPGNGGANPAKMAAKPGQSGRGNPAKMAAKPGQSGRPSSPSSPDILIHPLNGEQRTISRMMMMKDSSGSCRTTRTGTRSPGT